ncbi:hypothetical protein PIIN_10884 [Serendipita indica DSM 11827]|uniref:Uncharacterized protein n=1 Tax=Serendipita indica (strain DSM 11827) TaxID=1109443 RepID=G4U006_SERID|nr:hypothetical protein PIIN_10884 [Serendipita indica DSM 11827]
MSADFSLTFTNVSQTAFDRKNLDWGEDPVLGTTHSIPEKTLQARVGVQSLKWSQSLSSIATGNDALCEWQASNGHWFGVKIHQPVQILGIGTAPYYLVSYYDGNETKDYYQPSSEPGNPFTFPTSLGFQVKVVPTAGHATLALSVNINDLPK